MNRLPIAARAAVLLLAAAPAGADEYADLVTYDYSKPREPLAAIEQDLRDANTPARRRAVEDKLLAALGDARATGECKQFVCRMLRRTGSARCVPALAKLLDAPELSHMARFALQGIRAPEATAALIAAVKRLDGELRIGVVTTLGQRRDAEAVGPLTPLLSASDEATVIAAVRALGSIATPGAAEALRAADLPDAANDARADALLRCADAALAAGRTDQAAETYRRMFEADRPTPVRIAALRGLVHARKADAADTLLKLMDDRNTDLRLAGVQFIVEMPGRQATRAFAAALSKLTGDRRVRLLEALTARGDTAAAPAVAKLAEADDPALRLAAVRALGTLGDASTVPVLAKAVAAGGELGEAATESLNRLGGEGVGEAMGRLLDSPEPGFRAAILRVLAARADKAMIPAMLKAALDENAAVRAAAVAGLTAAAGSDELDDLVKLLKATTDAGERDRLVRALSAAAMRVDDAERRAAPVVAGLAGADADLQARLLDVLGRLGGAAALDAVRAKLTDPKLATDAVRALAAWPDAAAADDLLAVLTDTEDRVRKTLAFRGYLRLANLAGAAADAMYTRAASMARTTAEKKAVLAGLSNARSAEAIKLIQGMLGEPAVAAEAEAALLAAASNARDTAPDAARDALRKLAASAGSDAGRKRAREALAEMDKYRGYVSSWLYAGPYTGGGLFDEKLPPETGGEDVTWKALAKGVGPQMIDLQQGVGRGNNRAAYLRTHVFHPAGGKVRMGIGSDDGVKLWVDGKLVHANNAHRPCKPGEDKAEATLKKGWNVVLAKVTQSGGDWAFSLRIAAEDGSAVSGLRVDPSRE